MTRSSIEEGHQSPRCLRRSPGRRDRGRPPEIRARARGTSMVRGRTSSRAAAADSADRLLESALIWGSLLTTTRDGGGGDDHPRRQGVSLWLRRTGRGGKSGEAQSRNGGANGEGTRNETRSVAARYGAVYAGSINRMGTYLGTHCREVEPAAKLARVVAAGGGIEPARCLQAIGRPCSSRFVTAIPAWLRAQAVGDGVSLGPGCASRRCTGGQ